jgi:hypothetical protein
MPARAPAAFRATASTCQKEEIMNTLRRRVLKMVVLLNAVFQLSAHATVVNLINDGGFELPVTGPGGFNSGYLAFEVGSTFGGAWTVIGSPANNVALTPSTEYTHTIGPIITFVSQEGSQSLDLSGEWDNGAPTGVQQSFPTISGQVYSLSFYVGAVNTPDWGMYAGPAVVNVLLNGSPFQTAINSDPTGDATAWKLFNYTFTATGFSTTLAFLNGSGYPIADVGLDNVIVAVPEPMAASLFALGGMSLLALKNRSCLRKR